MRTIRVTDKGLKVCVLLVEGHSFRDVVCYQHSHHQPVDGDDASHDHGDDGLHDELWPHHGHGGDACATLCCAIGRS